MKQAITAISNIRLSTWFLFIINVLIAIAGLAIILILNNPLGLMAFYLLQPVYIVPERGIEDESEEDVYGNASMGLLVM